MIKNKNAFLQLILLLSLSLSCVNQSPLKVSISPIKKQAVLDPSQVYFLNQYYIIENLSLRLVEMDARFGYRMMLASEIKPISDLELSVKIKKTYYSNGDLVSLDDVKKSLERAMGNKSSHIKLSGIVDQIKIKDNELRIKLKKRTNNFLYYLTLIDLSILHPSQLKSQLKVEDWTRTTSGAFSYMLNEEGRAFLIKNKYFKLGEVDYPGKIELLGAYGRDSYTDFKNGRIDLGEFNLNSYDKHLLELRKEKNLHVIGNTGDMISFLALNVKNYKFKNERSRQWIQKKIMGHLEINNDYKQVARKAFQFFTPQVRGFLDEGVIKAEVGKWNIDLNKIPDELKRGITISTYQRAFEVTLEGVVRELEKVLGIPVKINNTVPSSEFEEFINKGDFEIFLGITSMDQVIVGESINLHYFSSFPMLKDVNGKIKMLMAKYNRVDSSEAASVVKRISLQMIKDSECVPLFYVASPFFYNKAKVNISGLDELTYFNLWKIKSI